MHTEKSIIVDNSGNEEEQKEQLKSAILNTQESAEILSRDGAETDPEEKQAIPSAKDIARNVMMARLFLAKHGSTGEKLQYRRMYKISVSGGQLKRKPNKPRPTKKKRKKR